MGTGISTKIVTFCAEEVERQRRGPIQVGWMVDAWDYAMSIKTKAPPLLIDVHMFGYLIERNKNDKRKWRNCGVSVGMHIAPHPKELEHLMLRWHKNLVDMTPEEAYKEFELIHPFVDGNGRVGKIIYSWLRKELDHPILPPNFFGGGNP